MKYVSTRGHAAAQNFTGILLEGLAPDGGLMVPEQWPRIMPAKLAAMRDLPYPRLAFEILRFFADDFPGGELKSLVDRTYTAEVFGSPEITPLRTLEPNLHILALSNGPTLAFKDIALQLVGNLFEKVLKERSEHLNVLGATSGDTGSAAEYALRGKANVNVFMLSPHGRMSAFQSAQMYALQDANIHNLAVKGVFDDCQAVVKEVNADAAFKQRWHIGAVNSINWARVAAQVVYYFYGFFRATQSDRESVSFAVPSGNFGNIYAGYVAREMGLPVRKLILASNENDVLDEFFRTGVYRVRKSAETYHTSSPSMDISKASNFERFVYDLLGRDSARVKDLFHKVETAGGFDLSGQAGCDGNEFASVIQYGFASGRSTHADRLETIRFAEKTYGITVDTHTADGIKVAREHLTPGVTMIVLETALPAKFNETIREALGRDADRPAGFENIEALPQRFEVMPADAARVKAYVAQHTGL